MFMYRAAVIGCGRIGCSFDDDPKREYVSTHAGAYYNSPKTDLIALADVDTEKLEKYGKKFNVPKTYTDYKQMLEREKPDILSVCTWNSTHLDIVKEAVNHGVKAIFCEKPIADTLASAREMVKLCKEKNVLLMIDHQRRFDKLHQEVKQFIQDGNLGGIQQASFYYTAGIANTGSHVFDLLRFFFGEVEWVQAFYSQNKSPNLNDPNLDGILKFKNGTFCTIQACDNRHFMLLELDIIGTKARLKLTHSGFDVEFYEIGDSQLFSGYKEIYPAESPINKELPKEFMLNAVEHITGCLDNKKDPISSGEDGLAALELICAFHESANADGKRVVLPLQESLIKLKSR